MYLNLEITLPVFRFASWVTWGKIRGNCYFSVAFVLLRCFNRNRIYTKRKWHASAVKNFKAIGIANKTRDTQN